MSPNLVVSILALMVSVGTFAGGQWIARHWTPRTTLTALERQISELEHQ